MNLISIAVKVDNLMQKGSYVLAKLEPVVGDFTRNINFKFKIMSSLGELSIPVDDDNFLEMVEFIKTAIFNNKEIMLITWDIKNFFTVIQFKTGMRFEVDGKFLDLKVAESFIGIRQKAPDNFDEFKNRIKVVFSDSSWPKLKPLYQKIYSPLISEVIPSIESEGLFNFKERRLLYPSYEIEGQLNGRMSCHITFENCFNPHSMSQEQKAEFSPNGRDCSFLSFDFHFMEVCTLAWLSGDDYLNELLSLEEDFYKILFKIIFSKECDTELKRSFCKKIFLPVFYGESANALSKSLNFNIDVAYKIIAKLKTLFPRVFSWADEYVHQEECIDYYGRKRRFSFDEDYKYRNFIIQSPASIICLERLVKLHSNLKGYGKLVAHIHDGYIIKTSDKQIEIVKSLCLDSLQAESEICKGLKLKANFNCGKTLA